MPFNPWPKKKKKNREEEEEEESRAVGSLFVLGFMSSPSGKRSRDPEEEDVYLDNFHSHKRYLSEVI